MIALIRSWLIGNRELGWGIAVQAGLALFALVAMCIDKRLILGINPWIKPLKFDISVGVMLLTMAAILTGLQGFDHARRWIGLGLTIALTFENLAISLQSLRGVRSHMNYTTPFNAALFASMGIMIVASLGFFAWTLGLVTADKTHWAPAVAWGVRLGLVTLLLGSMEGFVMVFYGGHTVGAHDGGPGLPFLNWSTGYGDLRIAHFFALHALQAFPLLGWVLSRTSISTSSQLVLTCVGAAAYIGGVWLLFHFAMSGRPPKLA